MVNRTIHNGFQIQGVLIRPFPVSKKIKCRKNTKMSACIYPARFLIPSLVHLLCGSISKVWISVQNAQMKIKKYYPVII